MPLPWLTPMQSYGIIQCQSLLHLKISHELQDEAYRIGGFERDINIPDYQDMHYSGTNSNTNSHLPVSNKQQPLQRPWSCYYLHLHRWNNRHILHLLCVLYLCKWYLDAQLLLWTLQRCLPIQLSLQWLSLQWLSVLWLALWSLKTTYIKLFQCKAAI